MDFKAFTFSSSVAVGIKAVGLGRQIPVQTKSILPLNKERYPTVSARNNAGKTVVFVPVSMNQLMNKKSGCVPAIKI